MDEIPGVSGEEFVASTPMKSLVPEGAIIPAETIPAETQVSQADLDKAAKARGELIELFG